MKRKINFIILLGTLALFSTSHLLSESRWEVIDSLVYKLSPINGKERWAPVIWQGIETKNKKDIIAFAIVNDSYPKIFLSNDTGKTWRLSLNEEKIEENPIGGHQKDFVQYYWAYPNEKLLIMNCDSGYYYKSTDNGSTFKLLQDENKYTPYYCFWDENNGFKVKFDLQQYIDPKGFIYYKTYIDRTTNGGENWEIIKQPNFVNHPFAGYIPFALGKQTIVIKEIGTYFKYDSVTKETLNGVYPDSCDYIHRSTDYGETWDIHKGDKEEMQTWLWDYFIDDNLCFHYGGTDKDNNWKWTSVIRKSYNGGKSWKTVLDTLLTSMYIYNLSFADSLVGIATTFRDIWWTYDGGETWERDTSYHPETLDKEIAFVQCIDKYTAIGLSTSLMPYVFRYTRDHPVSVNEEQVNKTILFPNPATDKLILREIPNGTISYEIYNQLGIIMKEGKIDNEINIEFLPSGIYFLKLNNQTKPIKFVKI